MTRPPAAPVSDGYAVRDRERRVAEDGKPDGVPRDDFVRDRARVLHSAALRRLAAKTQVVRIGESDFPRTRLTHSLECAQIGRELAGAIGADPDLVDAACLAHDLGHPPFGHNGEAALAEAAAGIGGFEGNAQSLRILTRLESKVVADDGRSAGLNLTRATLDATMKYPWQARPGTPKFGVYADDRPTFDWARDGAPGERRCAEAQVMDWADDVAYSVHDLEDGVQAGHVDLSCLDDGDERAALVALAAEHYLAVTAGELDAAAERLAALPGWFRGYDGSMRSLSALKRLTSELTGRLCGALLSATTDAADGRPVRRYDGEVVVGLDARAECALLKAVAERYVMQRDATVAMQTRQREQLAELLDAVLAGAPATLDGWLRGAWERGADDAARLRVAVDQVASLTDVSALAWHQRLCGAA